MGNFYACKEIVGYSKIEIFKVARKIFLPVAAEHAGINEVAFNHWRNRIKLFLKILTFAVFSAPFVHKVHCIADCLNYNVSINWFCNVLVCAKVHCLLCILEFIKGTQNNDYRIRLKVHDAVYGFKTAHAGHVDVHENDVDFFTACNGKGIAS